MASAKIESFQRDSTRRSPARRLTVLHAAAGAFAHTGYAATSMDEIAATAGITKLIVYRHFGSKEALYRAVLEQVFDRQVELFLANLAQGLMAEGSTRALLAVAASGPTDSAFSGARPRASRSSPNTPLAPRCRCRRRARCRHSLVAPEFAEWAAQTLFDQLVDAVLDWLDYGTADLDTGFITLETAAIRATVAALAKV